MIEGEAMTFWIDEDVLLDRSGRDAVIVNEVKIIFSAYGFCTKEILRIRSG